MCSRVVVKLKQCSHLFAALFIGATIIVGCRAASPPGESENHDPARTTNEAGNAGSALTRQAMAPAGFLALPGADIASRLAGKRAAPDPAVAQEHFDFSEEFLPDGSWVGRRSERRPAVRRGTWRVTGDRLCVGAQSGETVCRQVWGDARADRVAMSDIGSRRESAIVMILTEL